MSTKVVPFCLHDHPNFVNQKKEETNGRFSFYSNPLEPIAGSIKKTIFLGFPLKLSGVNLAAFGSKAYLKFLPLFSYFLIFGSLQMIVLVCLFLGDVNFGIIIEWFKQEGYNVVDVLAFFFIFVPQEIGLVKQNLGLLNVSYQWNKLNKFFGKSLSQGVYPRSYYFVSCYDTHSISFLIQMISVCAITNFIKPESSFWQFGWQ